MLKGFQDTSSQSQFKGFPNLNHQQSNSAYGYSGCTFWLDAAFGLNTQDNLGAVSRWQARVGGSIFEQATAGSQPRLILTDANYNNFPSVQSVDNARFLDTFIGLKFNPQITLVVISKVNTAQLSNGIFGTSTGSALPGINDGGTQTNFNGFGYFSNNATPVFQGTTESTNPRIKILTQTNIIINGNIETTGNLGTPSIEFTRLFRHISGAASLIGSIAEIIAFGYSMTSDQAIDLSNRINTKYAIY